MTEPMTAREKIEQQLQWLVRDVDADHYYEGAWEHSIHYCVEEILAAIEAERPAIEAAERERLAMVVDEAVGQSLFPDLMLRQFAEWIRSQG